MAAGGCSVRPELRGRGGILAFGLLMVALLALPASASAGVRCGVKDGILKVFPPSGLGNFAEIGMAKTGKRVVVKDDKGVAKCNGEVARLPRLEEIRTVGRRKTRSITALNMANGGFPDTRINVLSGSRFDIFFVLGRSKRSPGGAGDRIVLRRGRSKGSVRLDPGQSQTRARLVGVQRAVIVGATGDDDIDAWRWDAQLFLYGNSGDDRLRAGKKPAAIRGNQGRDSLIGGRGADLIVGGSGKDEFWDFSGNDFFKARDGIGEKVDCGRGGRDVVMRDGSDRLDLTCERITTNRDSGSPPPPPPRFRFSWAGLSLLERS